MIIIADSGSTKTDWSIQSGTHKIRVMTEGINPFMQNPSDISRIVRKELITHIESLLTPRTRIRVFFYGAGCTPEKQYVVSDAIYHAFSFCEIGSLRIEVKSDLLGAARALCQKESGIACILGTGSNSCYYNGKEIEANVSPLGFILGDEGSGATLGKGLVGNCLKHQFPEHICQAFTERFGMTGADIIQHVYREPLPNRFLAGLSPFLHEHSDDAAVHAYLIAEFERFFQRNVKQYEHPECKVSFIGSIAYYYQEELTEAAQRQGLQIGVIKKSPMEGLLQYHSEKKG